MDEATRTSIIRASKVINNEGDKLNSSQQFNLIIPPGPLPFGVIPIQFLTIYQILETEEQLQKLEENKELAAKKLAEKKSVSYISKRITQLEYQLWCYEQKLSSARNTYNNLLLVRKPKGVFRREKKLAACNVYNYSSRINHVKTTLQDLKLELAKLK